MKVAIYYFLFVGLLSCNERSGSNLSLSPENDIKSVKADSILLVSAGENQRMGFYLANGLDRELYPYVLDSRGVESKVKKVVIDHSCFILDGSVWMIPYYVHPGDRLNVFVNTDGLAQLSIAGDSIRNNELNFFVDLNLSVNRKKLRPRSGVPDSVFAYSKLLLSKQLEYSSEYFKKNKVSPNFVRLADTYLKDEYLSNVFGVCSNTKIEYQIKLPEDINLEEISKGLNLRDPKVESLAFYKSIFSILGYFSYQKDNDKAFRDGLDSCKKYFKNGMLEYASYKMFDIFMDKTPKEYNFYLSEFLKSCQDSSYVQLLRENYKPYKEHYASFTDNFFEETLEDAGDVTLAWKDVLSRYKGKIIVLDFWAKWCVPCIEELPHIKRLKENLDKNKVVIILVSIDINKVTWKKGLRENELEQEVDSYLIINSSKSQLLNKYKINSVPRYVVLNDRGELIVLNAPRPSQGDDLKNMLNKILKKNS